VNNPKPEPSINKLFNQRLQLIPSISKVDCVSENGFINIHCFSLLLLVNV